MTPRAASSTSDIVKARLRYGGDSPHSFFRDLTLKAERDQRRRDTFDSPVLRGSDPGTSEPAPRMVQQTIGTWKEVDARLEASRLDNAADAHKRDAEFATRAAGKTAVEKFDLTSGGASALIPSSQLPPELAARFEVDARSRAAVAQALGTNPVPASTGMTVSIAALTGGASVAIAATENTANSETDPSFGLVSNGLGYAVGQVDVSRQLLDRAGNGSAGRLDEVIAAELGRAAGTVLDQQILNGSGTSGQTRGLLNATGIQTTAYTSAAPTVAGTASKIGSNYADIATNYGVRPDVLIAHPRRTAWLASQTIGSGENQPDRIYSLYDRIVEAPAMPTTLNTTQDALLSVRSDAVHLFADSEISTHPDGPGSSTLTVRFRVLVRVAVVVPLGAAVGQVLGTGTTTPTFA